MEETTHILLAEDNKIDVALTPDAFHEAKIPGKIQVAHKGEEVLQYLFGEGKFKDRYAFPLPNIVLLDLKMPGIGGIEVLKNQRNELPRSKLSRYPYRNLFIFDASIGV